MWYAAYTKPRTEKRVRDRLMEQGIACYLPLRRTLKQWSDRKKWIEEPLLFSYIFVDINFTAYYQVLQTPGVVRFITFEGKAAAIPERQIRSLQILLASSEELEVTDGIIEVGDTVEVVTGSLAGFAGEVVVVQNRKRLLLRIEKLGCSILVNVPVGGVVRM